MGIAEDAAQAAAERAKTGGFPPGSTILLMAADEAAKDPALTLIGAIERAAHRVDDEFGPFTVANHMIAAYEALIDVEHGGITPSIIADWTRAIARRAQERGL